MARRDAPALAAARAALCERQGAQQKALTGYFACRHAALGDALADLAAEELHTLGELVVFTDIETAAALLGPPCPRSAHGPPQPRPEK